MRGIVVLVSHGVAHVHSPQLRNEAIIDNRNAKYPLVLGSWVEFDAYRPCVERWRQIGAVLPTIIKNGIVEVETRVLVSESPVFASENFGKVALLGERPPYLKVGFIYKCYVARDLDGQREMYSLLNVSWHIVPNTLVEQGPDKAEGQNERTFLQSERTQHSGVVVGKRGNKYVIYYDRGFATMIEYFKKKDVEAPKVGDWIEFTSRLIAPNKRVIDSNSFYQILPRFITRVEDNNVVLMVPAKTSNGKIYTRFVKDTNGKDFNGYVRSAKVVAYADEKFRFRWKLLEQDTPAPKSNAQNAPEFGNAPSKKLIL